MNTKIALPIIITIFIVVAIACVVGTYFLTKWMIYKDLETIDMKTGDSLMFSGEDLNLRGDFIKDATLCFPKDSLVFTK